MVHLGDRVPEKAQIFIWTHGFSKGHDTPKGCDSSHSIPLESI
jgi:hypothetical protein